MNMKKTISNDLSIGPNYLKLFLHELNEHKIFLDNCIVPF